MSYKPRPILVADKLRSQYQIDNPPVNPGLIVYNYPVRIVLEDWNDEISGLFVRGAFISHIGLNKNHPIERRHFTLWHEFYHFLEHQDVYLCEYARRPQANLREQEADLFAENFLMPLDWVRDYFDRLGHNVMAMARQFAVSPTAMRWRLKKLRLV